MRTTHDTRRNHLFRQVALTSLIALIALSGCGKGDRPELGGVRGKLTLDGKPLRHASVVFTPTEGGRQSTAISDESGNYELTYIRHDKGAKVGLHEVSITTATEQLPEERLPTRYNTHSVLKAEVKPGSNQGIDFDLTSNEH